MASEYAVCMGKRDSDHPLSFQWYTNFMSRWPELKVLKPRSLEIQRAKATTVDCVCNYYRELGSILSKYSLSDRPERIYNVDEKGLSTSHKPPAVVTGVAFKPQAVTSGSRQTVTVIGCGNALGHSVPPFFIFPGTRMRQDLLDGGCPGVDGDVSESGWSNGTIFRKYISEHLLKYLPERSEDNPVLIMYDGHRSHININLINWSKTQNLILFILPAHTSHVLQPLDIGCFGPFERIYNKVSHKFMRDNCGKSITRYNICELGCSAYTKALSPENLCASFRKAGIYPFNPDVVDPANFKPSEPLQQDVDHKQNPSDVEPTQSEPQSSSNFFTAKEATVRTKKPPTKKRRYLSSVVSGKAITEDSMVDAIIQHESSKTQKKTRVPKPDRSAPKPSTSGTAIPKNPPAIRPEAPEDIDSEESESDTELCCVCNLSTPQEVRKSSSLIFVKWVECSNCGHWVHLAYCTNVKVIRRGDQFLCPHCVGTE